jgi:hypothetical protein
MPRHSPSEIDVREFGFVVANYWQKQRDRYASQAGPIPTDLKGKFAPFFPREILDRVLVAQNIQPDTPPAEMVEKVKSFALPPLVHQPSIAFGDVIVFQGRIVERAMFHSLVHVVQYEVLGIKRYFDLFLQALVRKGAYINVPFEVQAYGLDSRFAAFPSQAFSVEKEVNLWLSDGRYEEQPPRCF